MPYDLIRISDHMYIDLSMVATSVFFFWVVYTLSVKQPYVSHSDIYDQSLKIESKLDKILDKLGKD